MTLYQVEPVLWTSITTSRNGELWCSLFAQQARPDSSCIRQATLFNFKGKHTQNKLYYSLWLLRIWIQPTSEDLASLSSSPRLLYVYQYVCFSLILTSAVICVSICLLLSHPHLGSDRCINMFASLSSSPRLLYVYQYVCFSLILTLAVIGVSICLLLSHPHLGCYRCISMFKIEIFLFAGG
jgi:hypothetical protein